MCRYYNDIVNYAPLYIHTFRVIAPRKLLEAQRLNQQYFNYHKIDNVPDRLRWLRHRMGLTQKEVADRIGTSRSIYLCMENGGIDYYPTDVMESLAMLFHVELEDLLDEYNRFLYHGQGETICEYRLSLGLNQKKFAETLGIDSGLVSAWEREKKRISKHSWEKYFRSISLIK